jgi:hypothetical protein
MLVKVTIARPAAVYRDAMRGRARTRYDVWLQQLKSQGCAAMGYRMTGNFVDRLCVKHLADDDRAVVVFDSPTAATIILLGPHDQTNPDHDVYTLLYKFAGIPEPGDDRKKPPCCGADGGPPDGRGVADELAERIYQFVKASRRRRG